MNKHPFAVRRTKANLTQVDLADLLSVTRHMVLRLEQGLFSYIPPGILRELSGIYLCTTAELEMEYRGFVNEKRDEFKRTHPSFKEIFADQNYTGDEHPLIYYRETLKLSRIGLCKGLCLHPDPITDWEHNKQRGVPAQLKQACSDIYWDYAPLESAVAMWRMDGRADAIK